MTELILSDLPNHPEKDKELLANEYVRNLTSAINAGVSSHKKEKIQDLISTTLPRCTKQFIEEYYNAAKMRQQSLGQR